MTHARLSVTLPDGTWIKDVSSAFPDAQFRVLAAMPGDDSGYGLVRVTAEDARPLLERMADHPVLVDVEPLQWTDDEVLVQFESSRPLLLFSARESGVPIELPVDIREGTATVEVTASRDRLSALGQQLESFGLSFDVEQVRQRDEADQLLTDRQRDLIVAAVDEGYYDTPRECTVTELAEAIGIAKSTCSETLHRAEERIIKEFVAELPDEAAAEPSAARQ